MFVEIHQNMALGFTADPFEQWSPISLLKAKNENPLHDAYYCGFSTDTLGNDL